MSPEERLADRAEFLEKLLAIVLNHPFLPQSLYAQLRVEEEAYRNNQKKEP